MAVVILAATSIPIKSIEPGQNGDDQEVLIAGRNVNMVSGITLPNGDPWLQRQNEPSIAVSTRNPLHLLAGANDYRTVDMPIEGEELPGQEMAAAPDAWLGLFKSFDGGQSWISMLLPGFPQDTSAEGMVSPLKYRENLGTGFRAAADPVVRAGTNGIFYYSGIAFNRTKIPGQINSVVFLARFIDNNNVEGGDSIKYIDTKIIADDEMHDKVFVDKPWIAVDVPKNFSRTVTIDGQQIPCGNVYIAYSVFSTVENTFTSAIIFRRSTDCGETWETPIVLSNNHELNQGAVIAVDPRGNGHVYVAWRRFNTEEQSSALIVARSANGGKKFHKVVEVATLAPFPYGSFDQPSTPDEILYPDPNDLIPGTSFRTNSYPTMAVDDTGAVYLAWAQRGWGPTGEARILLTSSRQGLHWESPLPIGTPTTVQGHQFMPSLTFAGGKLTMVWYDQRDSYCGQVYGFGDWISDYLLYRHTIDVWAAQANTINYPNLDWIFTQVSRYLFHTEEDPDNPGTYKAYQAQFNPPNYPLFKSGTLPFHGDYLDITPSPMFVLDENGHWRFNTKPSDNPLFHVSWTDNRDVRPPDDGDWVNYGPPTSEQLDIYITEGRPPCEGGQKPGMRNQNVYTSRITTGIEVGSPTNTKALDLEVPRAFVIFVKNNTGLLKSFRLTIANQPLGGQASFLQFDLLETLDVSIAPYSTISRQVFVDSTDLYASVGINIDEIDEPGGIILPDGSTGFVLLNGDPTSPGISGGEETHQPQIDNPNIVNWIVNPNIVNPNIVNPNIVNPNIVNPNIVNPNIVNPNIVNPNIVNPNIVNPNIVNPNIVNPNIVNPNIVNPNIVNANPEDVFITDVEWPVRNLGNTASSFTFKIIAKEALPEGIYAQLIVYKVHYTPAVAGSGLNDNMNIDDCELKQAPNHEVLLSVVNPNIVNPNIVNPNIVNPNIVNAAIENATFVLGPGEEAIVNLRIIDTSEAQNARGISNRAWQPPDVQDFIDSLGGAVSSQSANSEDAGQGIEEPPAAATALIISTSALPPGVIDEPYPPLPHLPPEARLAAVGGNEPYSWWIDPNDLPLGLSLDRATGQIFGTPLREVGKIYPFTYYFTAQVTDSSSPQQSDNQTFSITIEDPYEPPPPLTITTPSPLPPGTERRPYGATLNAVGGAWPYTWTKVSGSLPAGLSLDSGGFISGMPEIGTAGSYSFRIRVTDSGDPLQTAERDYTLTINEYTAPTYTISGTVTIGNGGPPLPGVQIRGLPGAPTTDSSGFYSDTVSEDWSGTATPFKAGYNFDPPERSYSQVNSDQLNQNYDAYPVELDHFEFDVIGNQTAGTPFSLTITAKDSDGNTVTTYIDTNTLSDTTGTISPASTGTFANGVWTGEVTITKAATGITITTTGGGKAGQSDAFNVTSGPPSKLIFTQQPGGGSIGEVWAQQPIVEVQDQFNNPVLWDNSTEISLAISTDPSGNATLSGTTTDTVSSGQIAFSDLSIDNAGFGYTLEATSYPECTPATSAAFDVYAQITGFITHNDNPISAVTDSQPNFHLFDEVNQTDNIPYTTQYDNQTGEYSIYLMPSTYGIRVTFDAADPYDGEYKPNDYHSYNAGVVIPATGLNRDIVCQKMMHLTSPIDNLVERTETYDNHSSPVTFRWDAIAGTTNYSLRFYKIPDAGPGGEHVQSAVITENEYTISLPLSESNEHYRFELYAWKGDPLEGTWLGKLFIVYENAPWKSNYRFKVVPGALDHFDFDVIGNQAASIPFSVTITAKDEGANTVTSYTGINTLNDTTGTISPTSTGAFVNGYWTGNVSITAVQAGVTITTSGDGKTGESNAFDVVSGGPSTIRIEDAADGTGSEVDIKTIGPDMHFTVYAISRDAVNNFVENVEATWSLIEKTDGVVDSDLVPAADNKSATFTGHALGTAKIEASHASLGIDTTGIISVIETQGDDIYDEGEGNDDIGSAQEIPLGTTTNLIYLDQDWYKIYITPENAGQDLKVNMKGIGYPNPNGSMDLDFGIWDGSQKLLGYTLSSNDDETLYIPDIAEGWYHIGVPYFSQNEAIYLVTVEVGDDFGIGYVSGRVTNEDGQGLENAYVELYGDPFDWNNCRPLITTDADGYYKVGFIPGDYMVRFNMVILRAYLQDLAPDINYIGEYYDDKSSSEGADVLSITANATITGIDAELTEGGFITGTVTDPFGTEVENIRIRVYDSNGRSINYENSDENGNYEVDRIPPGYFKVFAYPGSRPYAAEWYNDKSSLDEATGVLVESGQSVPGIDFQLTEGGSIEGRVTNEQGDGIQNIRVYAYDATLAGQIVLRTSVGTDENGYYSLDRLPHGNIRMFFNTTGTNYVPEWYDDKYLFEESNLVLVTEGQTTPDIDAVLVEGGTIEGRVTDISDNGLYRIYVSVFDIEGNHIKSVNTNQYGNYYIDRIPPGNHKIRFRPSEGNLAVEWYDDETSYANAVPVLVEANQTTSGIDAQLTENGGYITGTVTDSSLSGIGGVRVLIYDSSIQAAVSWAYTSASGFYSAPCIPTSNVKVYFDTDYYRLTRASEFYNDQGSFENATLVPGQAGETISGIDAVLGDRLPLTITTTTLPGGAVATSYSATLGATGGTPNYHWCLAPGSDPLPTGLVIQSYGVIEGTPTSQGIFPITVQVVDSGNPQQFAAEELSITISAYGGTDYIISGAVTYGGSPLKGVVMDGLPGNPQTNFLGNYLVTVPSGWSGTVTPNLPGYSFDPQSRNYDSVSEHQENHDYFAFYGEPLRITTTSLPDGTKYTAYNAFLDVEAPDGIPPFEWSVIDGSLPDGLILETSGEIHGTPSDAGDFIFTVQVTDSSSPQKSATQYLTLYIAPDHQAFWTTTYPYGGNINSAGLVLDPSNPSVIFAAANWRGIFKSEDAGGSWENITDYLELPFDRTDTRILKVRRSPDEFFTVSHGRIFKSTDEGMSWDEINNGISGYVQALTFHPTLLNVLYAGTQENGIFKTADGGAGWFNVSSGLPSDEIRSIAVDPDYPSIVYAGTLDNGIYKSADDGMSWFSINNNINLARVDDIAIDPFNRQIIYLAGSEHETGEGIFRSSDEGDSWIKLPANVSYSWPSGNFIVIDPANTDIIYSVSYQSIFKSTDGGANWTETQITPHHVNTIVIDPRPVGNPLTERTLYAGTDTEGIYKSTDSGQNWTPVNSGIRGLNFPRSRAHSLSIDQDNHNIIYTGSINGGLKSTNRGGSWASLNLNEWQVGTLATHSSAPGDVYAFEHNLWKSTDYGNTWTQLTGSGDFCCFGDGDFVIAPSNPLTFYIAGLWSGSTPNGIYKSTNGGSSWTLMNNGLTNEKIRTLAVHPTDADIVFAATMGDWPIDPDTDYGLFKTTDGGQNWYQVNCGLPAVLHINQIAIYPGDPNIIYMASEGQNQGIYRSDDGGECWRNIFGDNASSLTIHPDNPEILYVGTWNSGGFYVTLNGGGTWTQLNDGLPLNPGIESMAVDPEDPFHVFIGTTAGVYEATLNFDFTVTTEWLPEGVKDEAYNATLEAIGGVGDYTWSVIEGELPTGLSMDSSGVISGIPTVPGTFYFRVQVTDEDESPQSYTKILHITILNTYTLTTNINPGAGGSLDRNPDKPKYIQGEFVDLTITPNSGYTFTGWSGNASGMTSTIHVQMTHDKSITANLALTVDLPDYFIDSLSAPSQAEAGEVIGSSLNLVVGNQGAHDLYLGDIFVGVYLSSDPVITTGDILLWKGRSSIAALDGGTTIGISNLDLQIPTTVSEGDYHIGALVDETRAVAEQDEDNNYSSLPISIVSTEYGYFDTVGYWDGGSTYGIAVDEARNLALIGHGGALEILDISDPSNPVQRSKLHLSSSLVVTIVTSGNLAYIANGAAGLKVVDFSDADNPVEIGSCDTCQSGARSVDISGNYAYVTDYHHGLRIIDISNPTSPTEIAFLPLLYLTREVKVFGDYAYVTVRPHLAAEEWAPALRIIDVSEPANPTLKSTYGFQNNIGIPAIDNTGQYLFVPTAGNGLRILDVSNPDLPSEVSFYDGAPNQSEVTIRGNLAFVDDYANSRVVILDISNVFNPIEVSSYWFEDQQSFYGFEVAGNLWLVNRWYDSVRILDISNVNSPYEVGSYDETQGLLYFLDIANDNAFIINTKSNVDHLKILDISNLSDITETATHETPYTIYGIDVVGNHVYIPAFDDGLRIADITDPLNPEEVGVFEDLQRARHVVVSGNYAYVADGPDGLRIFDVSTPTNPILVSTWQFPGHAFSLAVSGNYVYVAGFRGGLRIIDVSDPLNPWEVGSLEFQGRRIRRVAVSENYAYITEEFKTLRVIDVSDPGNPAEVSSFDTYYPMNLTISGNLLFVSDWLLGLKVMDISDPTHPTQIAFLNELFNPQQVVIEDNYIYVLNRDSGFYVLEFILPGPEQTIAGKVTLEGSPLQGVVMNGLPGNPVTNGLGEYSTIVSTGWTGTVTPNFDEHFFVPPNRIYDTVVSDQLNQDYTAYSGYTISGTIMHSGQPITNFTGTDQLTFNGWDYTRQQPWPLSPPEYDNTTGKFTIPDLEPGEYYLDVYVDAAEPFDGKRFPGDYFGWAGSFVISEGEYSMTKDIDCIVHIHLTSPFDNSTSYGESPDTSGVYKTHTPNVLFQCDAVPEAESYYFGVWRYFTNGDPPESVGWEMTTNTEHTFNDLPLSGDNDYYLLSMSAFNGDSENIGNVSIVYDNGFGYSYPFKVIAPPPVSMPDPPSGLTSTSSTFTTGSSNFSLGDSVEYQFDWEDNAQSSWQSSTSVSHSWLDDGTYPMKARERKVSY